VSSRTIPQDGKIFTKWILILLLITGAFLRILSCGKYLFGDEYQIIWNVFYFIKNYTLMPEHFNYPTLFSYLSAIPIGLGAIVFYLMGIIPSPVDIRGLAAVGSMLPVLPARLVSTFFGLATIMVVFRIGEKFFDGKTGVLAAAFLTFSMLHIDYSSYALPDVTMTFFAAFSLLFSLLALKTKSIRNFILAGAFAGFAATTKYNGALVVLPIFSIHFIHLYDEKRILNPWAWIDRRIILSGLAFICAFFVGSPGWLLRPSPFLRALLYEREHMAVGHLGSFGLPYVRHLILFWRWENIIGVFFGLGVVYAGIRRKKQDIVLLVFIIISFLYIGSWQKKDLHYLIFLYPALTLLAARVIFDMLDNVFRGKRKIGSFLIIGFVLIWPVISTILYAYRHTLEDSRWIAQRWIQDNIPGASTIVIDWSYLPKLFTQEEKEDMLMGKYKEFAKTHLKDVRTYNLVPFEYSISWLKKVKADYLITSSGCFDRFFSTSSPSPGNPLFEDYKFRKDAYTALFDEQKAIGWKLLREFRTGKDPRILIYKRDVDK